MSLYKRGNVSWYKLKFKGDTIRESTKLSNKREAAQIEAAHKTRLAKGEMGIEEKAKAPTLQKFADRFRREIEYGAPRSLRRSSSTWRSCGGCWSSRGWQTRGSTRSPRS